MKVSAIVLIVMPSAYQAWMNNAWSMQFTRHVLNPQTEQTVLANPPNGHTRAVLWYAYGAIQSGDPALAERLIADRAEQGDLLAMNLMADAILAQNKFAEAVMIGQKIGDVPYLHNIGSLAQQSGSMNEALQAYETAWKMDIESGTLLLANFLINNKQDYTTAEFVLQSAMETFPNSRNWTYWSNRLGDVLRIQKRWDEAQEAYQDALDLAADYWAAHIGLGWVYYERGDGLQAALNEFQLANSNPESKGQGQYAIGQVLTLEKRYSEADVWLVRALAANPDNPWFYVVRGNAAREGGKLALALGVYQEAITLFPDFAQTYHEIAYAYQLNEQPEQAMAASEQAVLLIRPPNIYYYLRAGNIYEWSGESGQALEAYRQALLLDPANETALAGVDRLDP